MLGLMRATYHVRVASVIVVVSPIVSVRIVVRTCRTWHNMIWISALTVIMLPVRTGVVHIAAIVRVGL